MGYFNASKLLKWTFLSSLTRESRDSITILALKRRQLQGALSPEWTPPRGVAPGPPRFLCPSNDLPWRRPWTYRSNGACTYVINKYDWCSYQCKEVHFVLCIWLKRTLIERNYTDFSSGAAWEIIFSVHGGGVVYNTMYNISGYSYTSIYFLDFTLTAHNWQKWKRVFLTCPCYENLQGWSSWSKKLQIYLKNYDLCEYVEFGAISWKFDILSITA